MLISSARQRVIIWYEEKSTYMPNGDEGQISIYDIACEHTLTIGALSCMVRISSIDLDQQLKVSPDVCKCLG